MSQYAIRAVLDRSGRALVVIGCSLALLACNRPSDKPNPSQAPPRPQTMHLKSPVVKNAVLLYSAPASTRVPEAPSRINRVQIT